MIARRLLSILPVLAVLKLTACADQDSPEGTPTPDGEDAGDNGEGGPGPDPDGGTPIQTKSQCQETKKSTDPKAGKVFKGAVMLPEKIVDKGELFIDVRGRIVCAAADCSNALGYDAAAIITCEDAVIAPGLVNAHDHISFANNKPKVSPADPDERYEHRHDWRKGIRGHAKISVPGGAKNTAILAAELRFIMSGATSTASSGGEDGLLRNVDNVGLREGLDSMQASTYQTFPLGDSNDSNSAATVAKTLGDCTFAGTMDTATGISDASGYLPHIAEGIDAPSNNEMFCLSNAADPTHDLIKKNTAVIHGIAVKPSEAAKMRSNGTMLIWSPRSNISLYGNTAPVVMYDHSGVAIALGTDWIASGSMNMQRELKCADDLNRDYFGKHFTDKELVDMATSNAALAVGWGHAIGKLKAGYAADVAIFNTKDRANGYRAVIDGTSGDVILVLRGGRPLYGDAELLSTETLASKDCEDIPVCNVAKKACVKKDVNGVDLAQVKAEGEKWAPLFVCKTDAPPGEPTCKPSRKATASAPMASVYSDIKSGDKDGDGVPDSSDNCPTVFNPIRPMDGNAQADTDGDGIGDACDKCPLDSGETCAVKKGSDMDGDGVPNGDDNCPKDANTNQADVDGDGKGAVCDLDYLGATCDAAGSGNPGPNLCAREVAIETMRNTAAVGHPRQFSVRAIVKNVYVTAVKKDGSGAYGFYIQAPTAAPFQGMFVATPGAVPQVAVGNKVDVQGDYEELFGLSQLSSPQYTVTDTGTTLPFQPLVVDPVVAKVTGAQGEQYEGVLCKIAGPVTVTQKNADNPTDDPNKKDDFDEFAISTTAAPAVHLRVDDFLYDALDNNYPVNTTFPNVVGICGFSYSNRKIWPRSAADLQ